MNRRRGRMEGEQPKRHYTNVGKIFLFEYLIVIHLIVKTVFACIEVYTNLNNYRFLENKTTIYVFTGHSSVFFKLGKIAASLFFDQ